MHDFARDLQTNESLIHLAAPSEKRAMLPALSSAKKLLLPPVGRATVELPFSAMNCIERCCLLPDHTCQLMQLAII